MLNVTHNGSKAIIMPQYEYMNIW